MRPMNQGYSACAVLKIIQEFVDCIMRIRAVHPEISGDEYECRSLIHLLSEL